MERFQPTGVIKNIFGDNNAKVEYYEQFAFANHNEHTRIEAITNVASVCYANPKALGSESLYNRLAAESDGLPSSSFEFVPMLFNAEEITKLYFGRLLYVSDNNPTTKFGEWIEDGKYLLTNFRAITYLFEKTNIDLRNRFNTIKECEIIKKHFTVFNVNIDMPTFGQMVRHRANWQVLSRRYVSGSKVPFTFYISEKMKDVLAKHILRSKDGYCQSIEVSTQNAIDICLSVYEEALKNGVKPEEARRIIPQAAYTTAWCAFQPSQLDNFMKLRLKQSAQKEVRIVAKAMHKLLTGEDYEY